jgi:DMSO/TMAO reductase YedYZ heme-binding membrane subunit
MQKNSLVIGLVMLLLGAPTYFYLQQSGFSDEAFGLTLRISARLALVVFLIVFIARPLRQLTASSFTRALLTNRRYVGITFAAIMTVHLILLVSLNGVKPVIPGIIAYVLVYAMLITSFNKPAAALGPHRWRILHKTGIYVIAIVFSFTVVTSVIEAPGNPIYLTMAVLMLIALSIRIAAYRKTRQ